MCFEMSPSIGMCMTSCISGGKYRLCEEMALHMRPGVQNPGLLLFLSTYLPAPTPTSRFFGRQISLLWVLSMLDPCTYVSQAGDKLWRQNRFPRAPLVQLSASGRVVVTTRLSDHGDTNSAKPTETPSTIFTTPKQHQTDTQKNAF